MQRADWLICLVWIQDKLRVWWRTSNKAKIVAQSRPTLYFSQKLSSTPNKYFCCATIWSCEVKNAKHRPKTCNETMLPDKLYLVFRRLNKLEKKVASSTQCSLVSVLATWSIYQDVLLKLTVRLWSPKIFSFRMTLLMISDTISNFVHVTFSCSKPCLKRAATKLFGTSHRIGWENDIQTMVTMDPSPKTIELRANKIQWN